MLVLQNLQTRSEESHVRPGHECCDPPGVQKKLSSLQQLKQVRLVCPLRSAGAVLIPQAAGPTGSTACMEDLDDPHLTLRIYNPVLLYMFKLNLSQTIML